MLIRNQAITAVSIARRLAAGCGEDDLFVMSWRRELLLVTDRLTRRTTALAVCGARVARITVMR